jgi:hypothetical protein
LLYASEIKYAISAYCVKGIGVFILSGYGTLQFMNAKDPAAVLLGRRGGQAKVPKGFSMLSAEERSEVGKKAAAARWPKKKTGKVKKK